MLHVVATDLETAVDRLRARDGPESFELDEAELRRFATIFEPPGDDTDEGMRVMRHDD